MIDAERGSGGNSDFSWGDSPFVFGAIDMCITGAATLDFEPLLRAFRARKLGALALHAANLDVFCSPIVADFKWDRFYYYDTTPDHSSPLIRWLELYSESRPQATRVLVLGEKCKDAYLAAAADIPSNGWRPAPENKVKIEWFDDREDPSCPPCEVCGECS